MSQRNDNSAMTGFAIVAALAAIAFMLIYAIAAFLTVALTIFAFYAWHTPRTLFGEVTQPHEARAFVLRGIVGAGVLPLFAGFTQVLFDFQIEEQVWPHLFICGYILGSLGGEIMIEQEKTKAQEMREINPPVERLPPPSPPALPPQQAKPFQFGSWDDEEERK